MAAGIDPPNGCGAGTPWVFSERRDPDRVDQRGCCPRDPSSMPGLRTHGMVSVAMGLTLAALAVGCGSTGERLASRRTVDGAAHPAPGDRGGAHAMGDPVALGSGTVAVMALEDNFDPGRLFAPPRGTRYIAAQVRGCAGPEEAGVNFRPEYFALRLADHTEHDADRGMKKPALGSGTIPPGGCSDGWVTFVVPARATPDAVVYHGSDDVTWTVKGAPTNSPQ